jgi:hypothetical protein
LCCVSFFDLQILITPLVSFGHCVVCPSLIYRFWLPLWYLLAIVLCVLLWFTDSDYPFGIFKLFLWYYWLVFEMSWFVNQWRAKEWWFDKPKYPTHWWYENIILQLLLENLEPCIEPYSNNISTNELIVDTLFSFKAIVNLIILFSSS